MNAYKNLNFSPSYNQQFPVPEQVFPHTKQDLSKTVGCKKTLKCTFSEVRKADLPVPKKIGLGMKENKAINIKPNPMATVLSRSSTHLTETKKLLALPVDPQNLRKHITAKNIMNSF